MTLQSYTDRRVGAIDNTPLAIAKEEGEAQEEARRHPFAAASSGLKTKDLYGFAKIAANMVFNGARDAGFSHQELAPMRKRMATWVNIVTMYARDMRATRAMDIPESDRRQLLGQMEQAREEARRELFGPGN